MKLREAITIPVEIGDTILTGKFKNKRTVVKTIGYDEYGLPVINGKKTVTFRTVPKVTPDEPIIKDESKMKKSELQSMIREELDKLNEVKIGDHVKLSYKWDQNHPDAKAFDGKTGKIKGTAKQHGNDVFRVEFDKPVAFKGKTYNDTLISGNLLSTI